MGGGEPAKQKSTRAGKLGKNGTGIWRKVGERGMRPLGGGKSGVKPARNNYESPAGVLKSNGLGKMLGLPYTKGTLRSLAKQGIIQRKKRRGVGEKPKDAWDGD